LEKKAFLHLCCPYMDSHAAPQGRNTLIDYYKSRGNRGQLELFRRTT